MILDSQGILRKHIESIWPNRKIIESLIESTDFKVPTLQQQKMIFSTTELKISDSKFKISDPDRLPDW